MSTEVTTKKGLSLRVLILSLLVIFVLVPFSIMVEVVGIGTDSIFFPFVFIVLFNMILPKKIRLTPQELTILFIPLFAFAGKAFIVNGDGRERLGATVYNSIIAPIIDAFNNPTYADFYKKMLPSFMAPSATALTYAWNGLPKGVALPWGDWIVPIVYYTVAVASYMVFIIFLVFGVIGPQWVDVEHLVFPMAIPTAYLLNSIEEEEGKVKLFNFKLSEMKIFWGGFLIGAIVSAIVSLGDILPAFGLYTEVWEKHMDFGFIQSVFGNGAHIHGVLIPHQVMLALLLPFDILWTGFLTWVVVGLIYQPLGVRFGFLPYQPGVETYSDWWFGYRPPWPYAVMASGGLAAGVAVYVLWAARDRIKRIYNAMIKEDAVEYGVSLKTMGWGLVASGLFLLIFWTLSGSPLLVALFVLITYILWLVADARVMSEVWWHDPCYWFYVFYWIYPYGTALGQWSTAIPTTSSGNLVTEQIVSMVGNWIPRHSPMGSGFTTQYYYVARKTKTDIKDALNVYLLVAILGTFVSVVFSIWFFSFYGLKNNPGYADYVTWYTTSKGVMTGESLTLPTDQIVIWSVLGFILAFVLYYIRMIYPGFIVNPVALIPAFWLMEFMWLACLIALIVKYVLVKALGAAKFEGIVIPLAAGLALGSGFFVWIGPLYKLFTVIIPKLAAVGA